ncbi:hypothetical protein [Nocardioides ganghwensis]|jgi:hypothetical protein|uniref:Uncharacterized protein n=1 Tax=Nocardioides ganghwensis TaxID=252230 RepID=A0A4Q2SBX5_9ACTN|nr:hypothetical protein [Nocardioides ganghwensis]MBD3947127.1 hypothetical protein [Nocardioides ganghwensis]RYC02026.1 hypothetical protein EUA07_10820 [Nocardioides ganghwensis]
MISRSAHGAVLVMAIVASAGAAVPAVAATPVHIDADEKLEGGGSTFTSTIEGCSSGTVSNGPFRIGGGPGTDFGKFNGFKVFECADGGGFVVRLLAKFGEGGSTGTWAIVDGWDGYEDLHGAGTLVGTPTSTGINDVYDGTLRP